MDWLAIVADIVGLLGALFALLAWLQTRQLKKMQERESSRQNMTVQVVLQHGAQKIELPVEIRRRELTRSEILGRIGMLPMKKRGDRFAIGYLNSPEFLKQLNQIADGPGPGLLTISCTEREINQFDLD